MPLILNRSFNIYQQGFLLALLCLGGWVVKSGVTPAMAATQTRLSSPTSFTPYSARRLDPGRRFTFAQGAKVSLASKALQGTERYDYYAALSAHYGITPYRTTVLGLRGLGPDGRRHASGDNMTNYDDTFVVLRPDVREAREFLGSTHAGQAESSMSPNGVAQIVPGVYEAEPVGEFNGMPAWWVNVGWGDGRIPCLRDSDGDGFVGGKERERLRTATEILFHNGRNDDYGTSIGCQVLPPAGMRNFIQTVGENECFDYVLVDANQAVGRAKNG